MIGGEDEAALGVQRGSIPSARRAEKAHGSERLQINRLTAPLLNGSAFIQSAWIHPMVSGGMADSRPTNPVASSRCNTSTAWRACPIQLARPSHSDHQWR